MPPRMRTQSASRPTIESLGGGTGERVGNGGRGGRPREGNDERVDELNGQGNNQGLGANGGVEGVNGNVERANKGGTRLLNDHCPTIAEPLTRLVGLGCSYKEFLACNPKEYDGKGGGFYDDYKRFCLSHEMQKLESELWNHAMVGVGHAAYTDRFHELARSDGLAAKTEPKTIQKAVQISGALTDEVVRNGSIKKDGKRGNMGEPSKDRSGRDDNKRTRTGNAFATTVNLARGREFMLGVEEARQDLNIVTGLEPSDLGFRYEIEIASGQLVEIDKVIKGCKLGIEGRVFDIYLIPFRHGSLDVIV
ncbi:hypothetical protein Tco_0675223, partial [Tanacetum coccineum]